MKLVLVDRDGVINHDSPEYIKSPAEFAPIAGSIDAIVRLRAAGFRVAVCTNQAGIARGLFSRRDLAAIHRKLEALLAAHGTRLDAIYVCPHGPADGCECRKPKPGMLTSAMNEFGAGPDSTVFIGDSARDIAAARAVGCVPVLVRSGNGAALVAESRDHGAAHVFGDLAAAADWLVAS
jgi:D-glycero-D-manno-heptose 1,7-bisphosphate phosphatase